MRKQILAGFGYIILTVTIVPSLSANETRVPFVLHRGFSIVVHGSIGEIKGLNFIIDTGAVPSVVDRRLSHRLNLDGQPDQVSLFARTMPSQRVVLPSVVLGPIHATGVEALTQDLSFIERALGVRIDALIGLDIMGRQDFSIDFAASCLQFDLPARPADIWSDMMEGNSIAVVEMEFNGVPLRLMVDTGLKHVILFESRVPGMFARNRIQSEKVSSNIGGAVKLKQVDPPIARLAHAPLAVESVFLLETPEDLSLEIDGLLGVAALKPMRVDFNFERRAIGWKW